MVEMGKRSPAFVANFAHAFETGLGDVTTRARPPWKVMTAVLLDNLQQPAHNQPRTVMLE